MDLTHSYEQALPQSVLSRYAFLETRNAAAILKATHSSRWQELIEILNEFKLTSDHLVIPGGNESTLAHTINSLFRDRGWREARVDTDISLDLVVFPYSPAGETQKSVTTTSVSNAGYKVDNYTQRFPLDLEWNAKDGNLDRDLNAYKALYDTGLIDGAVLLTRTHEDLKALAQEVALQAGLPEKEAKKRLNTITTTNFLKLEPRMTRGDSGGCPVLAIGISKATWDGRPPTQLSREDIARITKTPLLEASNAVEPNTLEAGETNDDVAGKAL